MQKLTLSLWSAAPYLGTAALAESGSFWIFYFEPRNGAFEVYGSERPSPGTQYHWLCRHRYLCVGLIGTQESNHRRALERGVG